MMPSASRALATNATDNRRWCSLWVVDRWRLFYPPPTKPEPTNFPSCIIHLAFTNHRHCQTFRESSANPLRPIQFNLPTVRPALPPAKSLSAVFAPFGRLIACETVITVDSSSIQTPIIGLVTENVYFGGKLVIPAGQRR